MSEGSNQQGLLALTTEIVAAFVGNNGVAMGDVPALVSSVFQALRTTGEGQPEKSVETLTPAVPIKKSVQHDFIVCLEDGKKLKMLKRHLATRYHMTPEDYRRRWGLSRTTRWWRRPMPRSARNSPSKLALAGKLPLRP